MEAAGIAPASQIPQVVLEHDTCVEQGCAWLHYVCTEEALQQLVANWHRLTPSLRAAIKLAEPLLGGEDPVELPGYLQVHGGQPVSQLLDIIEVELLSVRSVPED